MAEISNISANGFKTLFVRDFPYLPVWIEGNIYFKNDVVFYNSFFFKSLKDNNFSVPSNGTDWTFTKGSINDYISDSDIERAFNEAKINFNPNLFADDESAEMVFYYLAAHYLVIDINNALNPFGLGFNGFTQSKSVGSVSESYGIPQWMLNDTILSNYAQTGYGRKYLSLIAPYISGQIILVQGKTTYA